MRKWLPAVVLILFAVLLPVGVGLWTAANAQSATISVDLESARLMFSADRRSVWFRGNCVGVTWEAEGSRAIFFNGEPTIGESSSEACIFPAQPPRIRLELTDGTAYDAYLAVPIITETPAFLAAGVVALILLTVALFLSPPMRTRPRAEQIHYAALLVVLVAAAGVRAAFMDRPLYGDEAFTITRFASMPYDAIRADYSDVNNHILHTLMVRFSLETWGYSPWVARIPAFVGGWLLVPLTYLLTRAIYNRQAALIAAALVAAHPFLVNFSVNARGYSLIGAWFLALMWLGCGARGRIKPLIWVGLALLSAAGFATITVFLYTMAVVGAWWLAVILTDTQQRLLKLLLTGLALAAGALLTLGFYAPIISEGGLGALTSSSYITRFPLTDSPIWVLGIIGGLLRTSIIDLPLSGLWGLLAAGAFFAHNRLSTYRVSPLWVLIGALYLIIMVLRYPVHPRTWVFAVPVVLMGTAAGLEWLMARMRWGYAAPAVALLLVVGLSWWLFDSGVMNNIDATGDAFGAELVAQAALEASRTDADGQVGIFAHYTAAAPVQVYLDMYRVPPVTHIIDGYGLTQWAAAAVDGEPLQLFVLSPPLMDGFTPEGFLWDAPPDLLQQVEVTLLETFEAGWVLYEVVPTAPDLSYNGNT